VSAGAGIVPAMNRVLVTRALPGEVDVPGAEVIVAREHAYSSREELHETIRAHLPLDAIVTVAFDPVDDAFLDVAGESLKVIAQYAVGYDNIDVAACRARGVVVTNTPDAVTQGTADMAWTLMMAAGRRLTEAGRFVRSARYAGDGPLSMRDFLGADFVGATLLIVGAGRIGFATAMRSLGWKMNILYVARSAHPELEAEPLCGKRVSLEEGLRQADFVSVHTPLTAETRHLIDAEMLALMKPSAVIVNTARGAVIDERALVAALREKRIWGAGLDVYENEPRLCAGLAELDNAVLTPHIGSASKGSRALMTKMVGENVRAVLAGEKAVNEVGVEQLGTNQGDRNE
jgi:glyoxylate reductase